MNESFSLCKRETRTKDEEDEELKNKEVIAKTVQVASFFQWTIKHGRIPVKSEPFVLFKRVTLHFS